MSTLIVPVFDLKEIESLFLNIPTSQSFKTVTIALDAFAAAVADNLSPMLKNFL